ncbi:hypothetical protein B0H11DRAFT_1910732 [Mycena galericulata]|nr:hypothetical protein B0H11DRAFT_1910732 [Mycena galericulata]
MREVRCWTMDEFTSQTLAHFHAALSRVSVLTMKAPDNITWIHFMQVVGQWPAQALAEMRLALMFENTVYPATSVAPFRGMVGLAQMSLTHVAPLWDNSNMYTHLTVLRLSSYRLLPWTTLKGVLISAVELRTLQLAEVEIVNTDNSDRLILRNLQNFGITFMAPNAGEALSLLVLPSIDCVRLEVFHGDCTIEDAFARNQRIFEDARVVQLGCTAGAMDGIGSVMGRVSSAVDLDLSGCPVGVCDTILDLVSRSQLRLPSLERVTLPCNVTPDAAEKLLRPGVFHSACTVVVAAANRDGSTHADDAARDNQYTMTPAPIWSHHFGDFVENY